MSDREREDDGTYVVTTGAGTFSETFSVGKASRFSTYITQGGFWAGVGKFFLMLGLSIAVGYVARWLVGLAVKVVVGAKVARLAAPFLEQLVRINAYRERPLRTWLYEALGGTWGYGQEIVLPFVVD